MESRSPKRGEDAVLQHNLRGTRAVAHGQAHRRVAVHIAPRQIGAVQQQLVDAVRVVLHRGKHQGGAAVLILQNLFPN